MRWLWVAFWLLTVVVEPALGCKCIGSSSVCSAVSNSDVVFIGTADSVESTLNDPFDLSAQRRMRALLSEDDLARMQEDRSPEGIVKLKAAYFAIYPDLPEPFKSRLEQAATAGGLEAVFDSLMETGIRTHFKIKDVFRGSKIDALNVWSDLSDCGVHFQIGETYLVYPSRSEDPSRLVTGACSRTKRVSDAGDDLAYLYFFAKGEPESSRLSGFVSSDEPDPRMPRFWDSVPHPVSYAFVELRSEHGTRHTETDRSGRFIFDGLAPGDYKISALDPGDDPVSPRAPQPPKLVQVPANGCAPEPILVAKPPPRQ